MHHGGMIPMDGGLCSMEKGEGIPSGTVWDWVNTWSGLLGRWTLPGAPLQSAGSRRRSPEEVEGVAGRGGDIWPEIGLVNWLVSTGGEVGSKTPAALYQVYGNTLREHPKGPRADTNRRRDEYRERGTAATAWASTNSRPRRSRGRAERMGGSSSVRASSSACGGGGAPPSPISLLQAALDTLQAQQTSATPATPALPFPFPSPSPRLPGLSPASPPSSPLIHPTISLAYPSPTSLKRQLVTGSRVKTPFLLPSKAPGLPLCLRQHRRASGASGASHDHSRTSTTTTARAHASYPVLSCPAVRLFASATQHSARRAKTVIGLDCTPRDIPSVTQVHPRTSKVTQFCIARDLARSLTPGHCACSLSCPSEASLWS
ncbi:hypothetical protein B0J11DRAFT_507832 [Dendryphion nanum]|uniref:Uncharacterized protein n=1 Tax=Dendryphion nanum TaxID=256645 RepID=A0A9P9DKW4_9PLEO|nr:hypothetical protein B0J11DRAFT_507832 [Dendryphion nanum]